MTPKYPSAAAALALSLLPLGAQTFVEPEPEFIPDVEGTMELSWTGMPGHTYFVLFSDNLADWHYAPLIESGAAQATPIRLGVWASAGHLFARVQSTNQSTVWPYFEDFDNDSLPNWAEVEVLNTDPLDSDSNSDGIPDGQTDSDGDGLTDAWEIGNGLDPTDPTGSNGASGDPDGDGFTNAQEQANGTDPTASDYPSGTDRLRLVVHSFLE